MKTFWKNVKKWIGIGVPGGWDDVAVRTIKTGVIAFAGVLLKEGLANADLALVEAATDAAWIAGGTFALNAILQWASSS